MIIIFLIVFFLIIIWLFFRSSCVLKLNISTSLILSQNAHTTVDYHYHRYVPVQQRNGTSTDRRAASTTTDHLNHDQHRGSGGGSPQLIAESISKLADNVGQMAESIREIAAAFTTTTHAAFELIRRQSEIIQGLIEK